MKSQLVCTFLAAVLLHSAALAHGASSSNNLVHGYECQNSTCIKVELDERNFQKAVSLPVCRMFCNAASEIGTLWPKPTGKVTFEQLIVHINPEAVTFSTPQSNKKLQTLWLANEQRFQRLLQAKQPKAQPVKSTGRALAISINLADETPESTRLTLQTDEGYTLQVALGASDGVQANITAKSYFGARHALETLAQLIVYDDIRRELQMLAQVRIDDAPAFQWRGLLLDTARNFFSIEAIKRTLDGMAMVKLNTFHWHITDSQSFPFEVAAQPELSKLGAYSQDKVYNAAEIADIVEYGRVRGIRVLPEFDAPAHVGEGWQKSNMTACFNVQPWWDFCVEPPCGQLDPTVPAMYDVLEDIYREMLQLFDTDVFHMGGDEVSVNCWNSSQRIQQWMLKQGKDWGLQEQHFLRLWGHFQAEALKRVDRVTQPHQAQLPIILWTSRLTEVPFIDQYLDKARYIVQIWTKGNDPKVLDILKRGYRVIVSNYDAIYFDCGGSGWVQGGNNWCSPYIGWQKVYDNDLKKMTKGYSQLVLGGEAAVWSEQIDEHNLDARFWPRASALAERLWSNPTSNWREAEARLLLHRQRLVEMGIAAEALQPEWCLQNEGQCPLLSSAAKSLP